MNQLLIIIIVIIITIGTVFMFTLLQVSMISFLQEILQEETFHSGNPFTTGAIIGDGDRKSWDPRAPMIWDNLRHHDDIYPRGSRTCHGFSRGCCHVA